MSVSREGRLDPALELASPPHASKLSPSRQCGMRPYLAKAHASCGQRLGRGPFRPFVRNRPNPGATPVDLPAHALFGHAVSILPRSLGRRGPWSLPNLLTYGRIAAVPAVVALLFWPHDEGWRWLAVGIYVAAAVTDYLDGWVARAWSQYSAIGRMLDPIADKLLVASCLMMLVAVGDIAGVSIWAAIIILCREILVSGLREFLAELKVSVPVSQVAKWKTALQLIAVGVLIAGPAGDKLIPFASKIGIALLWAAAVLTIYTGWDYFNAGIRHLVEEDEKP